MRWEVWLAYFAACWVIAISPGSGAVLSMSHGLSYGLKKTTTTIIGPPTRPGDHPADRRRRAGALLLASEEAFVVVRDRRRGLPDLPGHPAMAGEGRISGGEGAVTLMAAAPRAACA